MPVDPSIPLRVTMAPPIDPVQLAGQAMTLRNMGQRAQLWDAQIQREQAEAQRRDEMLADERAVNETVQKHAAMSGGRPDPEAVVGDLNQQGRGLAAGKYWTSVLAQRKEMASTLSTQLKSSGEAMGLVSNMLRGVTDDAGYQAVRPQIAAIVGVDLTKQYLPDAYDPPTVSALVERGMDIQERLQKMRESADRVKDGPRNAQEWASAIGTALSVQDDPDGWTQTFEAFESLGAPKAILATFPRQFDREAPKVAATLAMTPKERADAANQAATRGETARHNRAAEGLQARQESRLDKQGASGGGGMTSPQRNTTERWLMGELDQIEANFKRQGSYDVLTGDTRPAMTEDEKTQKRLDVTNSARRQIGLGAVAKVPADINQWASPASTTGAPPPPKPGEFRPLSSHGKPQPATPDAPAQSQKPAETSEPGATKRAPMTRAKAADILQGIAKRPPTKIEIDRFMQRNPFEQ